VLLHKPLLEALPEVTGTAIYAALRNVYQTGETYVAQEMPLMLARYQGGPLEEIYWTFTYQARHNDQGAIDGVLVFAYEVTDQVLARRRIEESAREVAASYQQLESVNQQLQKINADLDTFVYTASHDLKAPIVNIEGLLKALHKRLGPVVEQNKLIEELLALLDSQVKRFKATIEDLTHVARSARKVWRMSMGLS
jgi:signal transduction histidine kinase